VQKVFIDGEAGTTGLQIAARLSARDDIELVQIDPALRKDPRVRTDALNSADIAILCLPDAAAREAVGLVTNSNTRIIDASSAHRTALGWVYGFPELHGGQRNELREAARISNPGCYAIAAVSILHPLVSAGVLPSDWPVSVNGLSGYSGGGKGLIAVFEDPANEHTTSCANYDYALNLQHKHIPEMTLWGGLQHPPIFLPTVGRYYKGMLVHVPLALWALPSAQSAESIHEIYASHYKDEAYVQIAELDVAETVSELDPESLNGTNELRLHVLHNAAEGQAVVVAQLDNLGKGASGQAVQTLNLMLGVDESTGL
jgi:N-acetyl-gamma-glutamyl-phosphate reductase